MVAKKLFFGFWTIQIIFARRCPPQWSDEWKEMMGREFESILFPEFETANSELLDSYRESNCLPNIISISCDPDLDEIVGEYPFEHECGVSLRNHGRKCNFTFKMLQYNTYYEIKRSSIGSDLEC